MYTLYVLPALMAVAAASTLPISTTAQGPGRAGFYDPAGAFGSCGVAAQATELVAGIAPSYFTHPNPNKDPWCSKCALVSGPKGNVTVRVIDKCMGCGPNDINLSTTAFTHIGDTNDGSAPVQWSETPCPKASA
ncbi:RlpA-like double-psi beta-barrel-protein domain-containing protein-containing protein [Syncephalis plumigaleata]|nr:RlpA-like double-psi beta-barrel-protein domain-containing protein-containing protein [Syncephalis plumigaleata]